MVKNINIKFKLKDLLKLLVVISIGFLITRLVQQDMLNWPDSISWPLFLISIVILLLGFLMQSIRWYMLLKIQEPKLTFRDSFISNGITILGKYIPGKVWLIMGRAFYIKSRYEMDVKTVSITSFQNQILAVWSGFVVGGVVLFGLEDEVIRNLSFVVFVCISLILLLFISKNRISNFCFNLIPKLGKRIPTLSFLELKTLIPIYISYWLVLCLGFWMLAASLGNEIDFTSATSFALASVVGILAIIAPGGIGVREGILFSVLILSSLSKNETLQLVAFSRVWFLIGELITFFVSFYLNRFKLS